MAGLKNEEAAKPPADEAEKAAKPKTIRNKYHGPLQVSDGTIIPVGGSVVIDDMDALIKNRTVAAWLKAGVIEVI
jgi:hypothetical protein